jgi:acetate kinase 1
MEKLVFVLNCGSSSIKAAVLEPVTGKEYLSLLAEKLGLEDASIKWKQN